MNKRIENSMLLQDCSHHPAVVWLLQIGDAVKAIHEPKLPMGKVIQVVLRKPFYMSCSHLRNGWAASECEGQACIVLKIDLSFHKLARRTSGNKLTNIIEDL